ncbi:MAG: carboxypeptidase M32, partial [Kiloniellales bacterium]
MSAYTELEARFKRIAVLTEATRVLHWDMATLMPPGGAAPRAEQLAALQVTCHELITDPAVGELIDAADAAAAELDPWQRANLREMRRRRAHATALPADLVEALSKAASACETAWRQARADSDYGAVRPFLRSLLDLVRESAEARAQALGTSPYDALLDRWEPGARAARIDAIFDDLTAFLPGFLKAVLDRQAREPAPLMLDGPFPLDVQCALARRLCQVVGFDFAHGRLDESLHPFSGGVPEDARITTRYDEADFIQGLMAVLHETGHALYERGRPAAWRYQPVGRARGMILHESQSLLIEMQACRSRRFIAYLAPLARDVFGRSGPAWEADNLYRVLTRVRPGLIRVDADEVTYPAHVILRYRLERAMIAGELGPDDLPAAWNEGMAELIGVTPPDDRQGCLQDIHWYDGAWGYFPTYTLGAMAAAQLFAAVSEAEPEAIAGIGRGDFGPLRAWLGANVHAKGSLLSTDDLMQEATGRPL